MRRFVIIWLVLFYIAGINALAQEQETEKANLEEPAERRIIPIGNITVQGSYSKICGGSDLSGVYAAGNFAPAVKLSPRDYLIPLYNGLYRKQRQIVNEEEGGRLYSTLMSHNFSLMHKHLYSERLTQRINGLVSLNYNKETSDESFGDGLYDYRDYGANLDYQYNLIMTENETATILIGGKYYFRKYPNFKTLISLAVQTAPEEDEKDQNVWGIASRYTHKFADKLALIFSYDFLYKDFRDKHTIDSNGILDSTKRCDEVHFFKAKANYKLNKQFILGISGVIELNNSNQNYYDTMETPLALADDVFVSRYFDYNSYEIKPSLTYLFPLTEEKNIVLKVAYAYILRDYTNRNVKDSQGNYKSDLQEDNIHAGVVNISFPITKKLFFAVNADYVHSISNMEYERYYLYDYDSYHILSGFSYKF